MNNTIEIKSDGINVYATLTVKAKKAGKISLTILVFLFLTSLILIISTLDKSDVKEAIFPILILSAIFIFIPVRYLIWNLFGKENIIINTKTINYYYDYGIIRTSLKTINHDKLGTGFLPNRTENEKEIGKMLFYNYNKDNNLPELIHETAVLVELDKLKEIDTLLQTIYENEFHEKHGFVGYSLN